MSRLFENQTVIISGGIGDIGFATALAFAKRGAHVALCDIRPATEAVKYVKAIENQGVRCTYNFVDVANAEQVDDWVKEVSSIFGPARFIIANAATVMLAGIHEITSQQWAKELDVNINGAFYLSKCATALLREQKISGRVVFVGSWAGSHVHQHMPAYSVSKAAINMLCRCMALELAPYKILVNEIAPGYVAAGLSGRIWEENPGRAEKAKQRVPIKEVMSAAEVADQIVYLCNPENKHMTGSTLLMDGGLSLL